MAITNGFNQIKVKKTICYNIGLFKIIEKSIITKKSRKSAIPNKFAHKLIPIMK